jgi:hypothetical protein
MEYADSSIPKKWHRLFGLCLGIVAALSHFSSAIEKGEFSYLISAVGFVLLGIAWFRVPLALNQPIFREYKQLAQGQAKATADQIATICTVAGVFMVLAGVLVRWLP